MWPIGITSLQRLVHGYNKSKKMTSNFVYNGNLASIIHEMGYNGLPVCAMCERVNRYTVSFLNKLTLSN